MTSRSAPTFRWGRATASAAATGAVRRVWLYGLGMLIPAAYFAQRYPLRGNADELLDIGKMAGYQTAEFVWFCLGLAAMFALYLLAARECRRLPFERTAPAVFGIGVALTVLFAWMYPVNAVDVYIYSARSHLWTEYGQNPSAVTPDRYWDTDPYVHYAKEEWSDATSPYGPLWNLIAAPATLIGGNDIAVAVVVFKFIAVLAVLLGAAVIALILLPLRPEGAAAGALVYLWNPLILWEGVGNGHNDVIVVLPLLLAAWAWTRRRYAWVVPFLVVAALIKYVTLLILPLAVVALWRVNADRRDRLNLALLSAAYSLFACLFAFFPFYNVGAVIDSARRQNEFVSTSLAAVANNLIRRWTGGPDRGEDIRHVLTVLFLAAFAWQILRVWKAPSLLPIAAFETFFAFLFIATWHFRVWYLIWPIALVAILPLGWPFLRIIAWAVAALASYGIYIWVWDWWSVPWPTIRNTGVLFTFIPPAVVTLVALRTTRSSASSRPPPVRQPSNPGSHRSADAG